MKYLILLVLPTLLPLFLSSQPVIMFPGDANNDGRANHYDLLPVGIAFGIEGFPRPAANPNWIPQLLPEPWFDVLPVSQINLGFADADGNGFIDSLDIDAIAFNFDSTQNASDPPPMPYLPLLQDTCFTCPKPDLIISFDRDTAMINDTFFVIIDLVFPDIVPELGALGIAFNLQYDPENVVDSLTVVFPDTMPGDLMFITATSTLARPWRDVAPGQVGFGAAGKGMNALYQPRELGKLRIIVDEAIIRSNAVAADFWVDAFDLLILNQFEQVICPGHVAVDTIVLFDPVNSVKEPEDWQTGISMFPNPAGDLMQIDAPDTMIKQIELWSASGHRELVWKGQSHNQTLSLQRLPAGVYLIKIHTDRGGVIKKLMHK